MDNEIRWSEYTLPNNRKVYLTQRPDRAAVVGQFVRRKRPIVRFCFTDDLVVPKCPYAYITWHWFPWVPRKQIVVENVFAYISSMNYYNTSYHESKPVWLHCDSSTMRAPTYFGLYLYAVYPDEIQEICDGMTVNPGGDLNFAKHSCAKLYADISLKEDSGVKDLIKSWQIGGEERAYDYYMGEMENDICGKYIPCPKCKSKNTFNCSLFRMECDDCGHEWTVE